jgi:hypothetical protein
MIPILKKPKQEKVALNLQNPANQRVAIKASLDHKVPLLSKGNGIFIIDLKKSRDDKIYDFFKQFIAESVDCRQGVIDSDDPKCDYIVIYDIRKG